MDMREEVGQGKGGRRKTPNWKGSKVLSLEEREGEKDGWCSSVGRERENEEEESRNEGEKRNNSVLSSSTM